MLKELLEKQRRCTEHFFENLDLEPIEKLTQLLLKSQGMLFFTGVGKSGLVAKKIAFTMVSTGTRAFYLTPTDAVHGDLGMISSQDTLVILSKSGESDELLNLIPAIKEKKVNLVGILCNPHSRLAAACDSVITLPFIQELCPFDIAPTMSTTSQVLFGDLLTIALMKHKKFTLDDYGRNHPSGRIGKRITLKVKDLMLSGEKIPLCHAEDYLKDILIEFSNKRCGCILIVDNEKKLLGVFTDGDLRRTLQKVGDKILHVRMNDVMNHSPTTIGPQVLAWDAMKQMEANPNKRITILPVVDENHIVVGIIHLHDLVQAGL